MYYLPFDNVFNLWDKTICIHVYNYLISSLYSEIKVIISLISCPNIYELMVTICMCIQIS